MGLVEVMVALTLLAIAAVSITQYVLGVSKVRASSSNRSASLIAIQETMDSVRSLGFSNITTGARQWNTTVGRVPLTISTDVVQAQTTMKTVDVSVRSSTGKVLQRFITSVYKESR